jgi:hypothetical protein
MVIKKTIMKKYLSLFVVFVFLQANAQIKDSTASKLLSKEKISIDSCNGKETLAKAKDVFKDIDESFTTWNIDKPDTATKKTPVQVYEMPKFSEFWEEYKKLSKDLNKLSLTQHQIKNFCRKNSKWLNDNDATLFLFKVKDKFYIAFVYVDPDGLIIFVRKFGESEVWGTGDLRRVVIPEIK